LGGFLNIATVCPPPAPANPPAPGAHSAGAPPAETSEGQRRSPRFGAMYNAPGQPGVNLPLYWSGGGLPIGVMLAGPMGGEGLLISLSAQVEAARPWKDRHSPLW